jgi:hypothetical protein
MKRHLQFILISAFLFIGVVVVLLTRTNQAGVSAAPEVFASPIHAGCYIAAPGDCRIHIDPFTVNVDDGNGDKLAHFQITANGNILYDFKPDMFNPPIGDYTPSMVMQDFAATCSQTYQVNLSCQDSGDPNLFNCGQTSTFTCPSSVP